VICRDTKRERSDRPIPFGYRVILKWNHPRNGIAIDDGIRDQKANREETAELGRFHELLGPVVSCRARDLPALRNVFADCERV
jgi:hypothetical protein